MSVAYTCSHYSPTNLQHGGPGSAPGACVVFLLLLGELFIHLHTVVVDHIARPADSELAGFHPPALKVQRAAGGGEAVNLGRVSSLSCSLSVCLSLSFTLSLHSTAFHLLCCSFHFFIRLFSASLRSHFSPCVSSCFYAATLRFTFLFSRFSFTTSFFFVLYLHLYPRPPHPHTSSLNAHDHSRRTPNCTFSRSWLAALSPM